MPSKLKSYLKWIVPIAVFILLILVLLWQTPKAISVTVSPETVLKSTTTAQTLLTFNLNIKSRLPVWSAYLKTLGTSTASGLKVSLTQQPEGSFTGSVEVPADWLGSPKTITLGLYLNGIKTADKVRFAITDIPVTLPPDLGEAGKSTLEGIDSDNDGVRDDLQREIVFLHPGNDELRRVLRAMVKKEQEVITSEGDHEHFKELKVAYLAFWDCYNYLVFGNSGTSVRDYTNGDILWNMLRNTGERKEKDEERQYLATPYNSTLYGTSQACMQPVVQAHY